MIQKMLFNRNYVQCKLDLLKTWIIAGFMIIVAFCATVQAQDDYEDDCNLVFPELVFDIGMSLVDQATIVDMQTMKDALSHVYQTVDQVAYIVDMYLAVDEEIMKQDITSIDALIDYELHGDEVLAQAALAWLSACQNLFIVFTAMHPEDSSFAVWCDDLAFFALLADDEMPKDPDYMRLWLASYAVLQAQVEFESALKDAE